MRLDNVQLRYGRRGPLVLAGVDVVIESGETVVILGRNGAGKSTLLQVIAGVLRPTRGAVSGRPAGVGWVPERFPADQPFTVRGYLRAMAAVRGVRNADSSIGRLAERLGFESYLLERLLNLSKGTAQKVGLAQALLPKPELLVLDEPWEGLDSQTYEEMPALIAEVVDAGGSVVISDHRGEAGCLPNITAWLLENGRLDAATATVRGASAVPNAAPLWASPTMLTPTVVPAPGPGDPSGSDQLAKTTGVGSAQPTSPEAGRPRWVVEVAVAAADRESAASRLRTAGHEVLAVRQEVVG